MPPNRFSRHRFCTAETDEAAKLLLSERVPYRYRELPDNRQHVVRTGDSLWALAGRYFAPMPRPAGLWWIIADYQPEPIHDPTIALVPGVVITIPSLRTVQEEIFNERRRRDE